jgi:hypothetical protein
LRNFPISSVAVFSMFDRKIPINWLHR